MHGGARPGAGRPKGSTTRRTAPKEPTGKTYADVLHYLRAVALGTEPADALRIAAAKAALPYEAPRQRAPVRSPTPRKLEERQATAEASAALEEWEQKAQALRARMKRGET